MVLPRKQLSELCNEWDNFGFESLVGLRDWRGEAFYRPTPGVPVMMIFGSFRLGIWCVSIDLWPETRLCER